jgi:subtilisin family serine protease
MSFRATTAVAFSAAALLACHDSPTIPHTPTSIVVVSGNNQSANVATALDSALVVRVLDGASKSVSGVSLKWTVVGGGSLSATTSTTDNNGLSSVHWTLSPAVGPQVVTVTSAQIGGASVSFVAGNGPTIMGTVTAIAVNSFGSTFSRSPLHVGLAATPRGASTNRPQSNRIVIGFKSAALGLAPVGSAAYRTMATARSAGARLNARVATFAARHGFRRTEVSPAILAARLTLVDTARIASVMDALRGEADVAYVEREATLTIRDAPPARIVNANAFANARNWETASSTPSKNAAPTLIPNDRFYPYEMWAANMVDLPKAWAVTTGSSSVTVAVLDMGVRFEHPSIAPNLTADGYDFVNGFDFDSTNVNCDDGQPFSFKTTAGDGDGPDPDPTDVDDIAFDQFSGCWFHESAGDHGLWTSGIIGAVGNQNIGVAGVNWNVKIRPVRVLDITGSGSFFDVAQGLLYAAGLPALGHDSTMVQTTRAPIVNISLGGGFDDPVLRDAVTAASNVGTLIVASAGNNGSDERFPTYPAAYPGVMAVAAVGMDGALATYTNAGTNISVAAPGGDFRLDDNGGGGVIGPGWDFELGEPQFMILYGTSASAPFVSGIAALLLSQTPSLTAAQLRSRIEQFATRPAGSSRSDSFGWGIVNAYSSLTQTTGPARQASARLIDATTGAVARTTTVNADGSFAFAKLTGGSSYYLQAGEDEAADGLIGVPGRRFTVAGGLGNATVFNVGDGAQSVAIALGLPFESEPNDDAQHANLLAVGSYVVGTITMPDVHDIYRVTIPTAGTYTFETSGLVGSCGLGIELDTFLTVSSAAGAAVGSSDNINALPSPFCSRVRAQLTPGIYYATVGGSAASFPFTTPHGRYRLQVRSGN